MNIVHLIVYLAQREWALLVRLGPVRLSLIALDLVLMVFFIYWSIYHPNSESEA